MSIEDAAREYESLIIQQLKNDTEVATYANEQLLSRFSSPESAFVFVYLLENSPDPRVKDASLILARHSIATAWSAMEPNLQSSLVNALLEAFAGMTDILRLSTMWYMLSDLYDSTGGWASLQGLFNQIQRTPNRAFHALLMSISILKHASDFDLNPFLPLFGSVIAESVVALSNFADVDRNLTIRRYILKLTRLLSSITGTPLPVGDLAPHFAILPDLPREANNSIVFLYWRQIVRLWSDLSRSSDRSGPIPFVDSVRSGIVRIAADATRTIEARSIPLLAICDRWSDLRGSRIAGCSFFVFLLHTRNHLFRADLHSHGWSLCFPSFGILSKLSQVCRPAVAYQVFKSSVEAIPDTPYRPATVIAAFSEALSDIPESVLPHIEDIVAVVQGFAENPEAPYVCFAVLDFVSSLDCEEFSAHLAVFLPFLAFWLSQGGEIGAAACSTLAEVASSLGPDCLRDIIANYSDVFLELSPVDFFSMVAKFYRSDAFIPLEEQGHMLDQLLNALDMEPDLFTIILYAIAQVVTRSEEFVGPALDHLGRVFELRLDDTDAFYGMLIFMVTLCMAFGAIEPRPFISRFAAPVLTGWLSSAPYAIPDFLGPVLSAIDIIPDSGRMTKCDIFVRALSCERLEAGDLLVVLEHAFGWLADVEVVSDADTLELVVRSVFCGCMEKRRDPELVPLYFEVGDWLRGLVSRNKQAVDAAFLYISKLLSFDIPDREQTVAWVLHHLRNNGPYQVLGCCADMLALDLMCEEDARLTAEKAFSSIGIGNKHCFRCCVRAIAELLNKKLEGVLETVLEQIQFFLERVGQAPCMLGRLLIQVGIERELEASVIAGALAAFPPAECDGEADGFAEAVLGLAGDERLSSEVMMALGRYFASRPIVKTGMGLSEEIVVNMGNTLRELMGKCGVEIEHLAAEIGQDEMIRKRFGLS
jgi:hypothetical protein